MEPRELWERHTVLATAFCQSDEEVRTAQTTLDDAQAGRARSLAAFAVMVGNDKAVAEMLGLAEREVRVARRTVGREDARSLADDLLTPQHPHPRQQQTQGAEQDRDRNHDGGRAAVASPASGQETERAPSYDPTQQHQHQYQIGQGGQIGQGVQGVGNGQSEHGGLSGQSGLSDHGAQSGQPGHGGQGAAGQGQGSGQTGAGQGGRNASGHPHLPQSPQQPTPAPFNPYQQPPAPPSCPPQEPGGYDPSRLPDHMGWSPVQDAVLVDGWQSGVDLEILALELGTDLRRLTARAQYLSTQGRLLAVPEEIGRQGGRHRRESAQHQHVPGQQPGPPGDMLLPDGLVPDGYGGYWANWNEMLPAPQP